MNGAVAWALLIKGSALTKLGRHNEATRSYDDVVRRYGNMSHAALNQPVAWALFQKGLALGRLGLRKESTEAYDEVVRRFGNVPDAQLGEQVASALLNKAAALQKSDPEEAKRALQGVIRRFDVASNPLLRLIVQNARGQLRQLDAIPPAPPLSPAGN